MKNNLIRVVEGIPKIKKEQMVALNYIINTAVTSKSKFNSLFIFWLSIVALIVGVIMDFGLI